MKLRTSELKILDLKNILNLFCLTIRGYNQSSVSQPLTQEEASLGAQTVKNMPAIWETQVQSLGWGRPPGKGNG